MGRAAGNYMVDGNISAKIRHSTYSLFFSDIHGHRCFVHERSRSFRLYGRNECKQASRQKLTFRRTVLTLSFLELPSPTRIDDGTYPTAVLDSGRNLTRVYRYVPIRIEDFIPTEVFPLVYLERGSGPYRTNLGVVRAHDEQSFMPELFVVTIAREPAQLGREIGDERCLDQVLRGRLDPFERRVNNRSTFNFSANHHLGAGWGIWTVLTHCDSIRRTRLCYIG